MLIDIKVPYTTRPSMLKRSGPLFCQWPDPYKLGAKREELEKHQSKVCAVLPQAYDLDLLPQMARHCGKPVTTDMITLGMNFQEDIAIMHEGRLVAVCFCFPSGWVPADKLGMCLSDIHQPVADNSDLVKMSMRLAQTMADPVLGGFQRQVWTVTANPFLSNLPGAHSSREPSSIRDLYLRWETQTTEPLGNGVTSLFFVDVNVTPLETVWPELGHQILDSMNSMSDAVLTYKNLHSIRSILNQYMFTV